MAYFATARITRLESDPSTHDHFYAYVADFLEFERHVPFREGKLYYESSLKRPDGGTNKGMFGRAVRALPDRSEEHTSELQSLMRISYAVFCLKKKNKMMIQTLNN